MKVTATRRGFIHGVYRKPGDKFECSTKEFSEAWMTEGDVTPKTFDNDNVDKAENVKRESLEIPSLMNKDKDEEKAIEKEKKPAAKKKAKNTKKKTDTKAK